MVQPDVVERARKNGSGVRVLWGKRVSVSDVVDLLAESAQPDRHFAVKTNAAKLIQKLADNAWFLAAGPHSGGVGGGGRETDETNHITIRAPGGSYHLRLDKRGHIFEITGPGMPVFYPWAAPGTDVGGRFRNQ